MTAVAAPISPAGMLDQVIRWSSINSGTRNVEGLARMAAELAQAFSALPGRVELIDPAAVEEVDAAGVPRPVASGRHLVVRVRPGAARRVLLTGHMDTVYGADDPFQQCQLGGDRLNGPGVLDMKAGLAIMLAGLTAFEASGPAIGYDVLVNADEEAGSPSSSALIRELAANKIAGLTYEPTMPGGVMAASRPGSGNFAAVVTGRSAHAGRDPQQGRNAVVAAGDLALRLAGSRRGGLSVNPARIDGGGPNNVVPALAVLRFNLRPATAELAQEALALVERLARAVERDHDVAVAVHGGIGRPPKPMAGAALQLRDLVSAASLDLGQPLEWRDAGGVCDGNNVAACGVPVVDTMGGVGGRIHSPEEFLDVTSLAPKARLTEAVMRRLDAGASPA